MRLAVVGAGYVGLVAGACLADHGHDVILVDIDASRVDAINSGHAPFFEAGLGELLSDVVPHRLRAVTDLSLAIPGSDIVMLAVGTPSRDGEIDLAQLESACTELGELLRNRNDRPIVVVRSTVVPGTTDRVLTPLLERSSGLKAGSSMGVAVNPEFLTEGQAVADFDSPDRIVIGATDPDTSTKVAQLYESFDAPIITTTPANAEMIKYASNTLLATLISFSNEIAGLAATIEGVDAAEVMPGVHASRYLTTQGTEPVTAEIVSFLEAGCGYGGSCLPKDTQALASWGEAQGVPMRLLRAVDGINRDQAKRMVALTEAELGSLASRTIGVLGLAFRPGTDDVRDSPAFPLIQSLLACGAEVWAHDPLAIESARAALGDLPGLQYESDLARLISKVEAALLVTSWDQYRDLPDMFSALQTPPLLVDGRRLIPKGEVSRYAGIGL